MQSSNATRNTTFQVIASLFGPLAHFALQNGLSASECQAAFRVAAIKCAVQAQINVGSRVNFSGIAALTGIPRGEIAKVIKAKSKARLIPRKNLSPKSKIITVWRSTPQFTSSAGKPLELKIYGKGATFNSLVKKHGRGIPTRALLDELSRTRTIEILPGQLVRLKASASERKQTSPRALRQVSVRASRIVANLLNGIADPESQSLFANLETYTLGPEAAKEFRSACRNKATKFLAEVQEDLQSRCSQKSESVRSTPLFGTEVVVSIYCHEELSDFETEHRVRRARRNLRRTDLGQVSTL